MKTIFELSILFFMSVLQPPPCSNLIVFFTQIYASLLCLPGLFPSTRAIRWPMVHYRVILFTVVSVYTYRDLLPLGTYDSSPKDVEQGWQLWAQIGISYFIGIFIPLLMPREYRPIDPFVRLRYLVFGPSLVYISSL